VLSLGKSRTANVAVAGVAVCALLLIGGVVAQAWWLAAVGLALGLGVVVVTLSQILASMRGLVELHQSNDDDAQQIRDELRIIARRVGRAPGSLEARLRHHVIRDTSALLTLHDLYPTPGEHVPLTSWSAYPATALMLTEHVRELPADSTVLELGSGATTVWMALASRRRGGDVRIVSLEASADFADVTGTAVRRNGVDDLVDLRVATLDTVTTKHGEQQWYEAPSWNDVTGIGLLVIDGPPGGTGPHARYPAVELLADRLAPGAIVVIDDADRDDEKAMLAGWLALDRDGRHPEIIEVRENATALRMP
jgi:predicted O-methyltransferase YrrM